MDAVAMLAANGEPFRLKGERVAGERPGDGDQTRRHKLLSLGSETVYPIGEHV
jgi:hypothetical protein